jgi:hypothetical protein
MTYDWASPGAAGLPERIARRLSEIAATPGVSGLALMDASPPGYNLPSPLPDEANPLRPVQHEALTNVGYNPLARVAFIRSAGFDPIDMMSDTFAGNVDLSPLFFRPGVGSMLPADSAAKSVTEWNRFRSEIIAKALADLYVRLTKSLPKSEEGFPVYLQNLDASSSTVYGQFSRWKMQESLPERGTAEKAASHSLLWVSPEAAIARQTTDALTNKKAWAGLVLNFSEVPVSRALELLQEVLPPSAAR